MAAITAHQIATYPTRNVVVQIIFPSSPTDRPADLINAIAMNPDVLFLQVWTEQTAHKEYKWKAALACEKSWDIVIGDAVNVASRICDACKNFDTNFLSSADVANRITYDVPSENALQIRIRGREGNIDLIKIYTDWPNIWANQSTATCISPEKCDGWARKIKYALLAKLVF